MDNNITVKTYSAWEILMGAVAALLLTGALMAVYGWQLGMIFGAFLVVARFLVELRIIR